MRGKTKGRSFDLSHHISSTLLRCSKSEIATVK